MAHPASHSPTIVRWLLISLLLFGIGWALLSTQTGSVFASPAGDQPASKISAQITPTPLPTEFSEEIVREGQPTGIIVGAVALVLIIILGTAPFLLRKRHDSNLE